MGERKTLYIIDGHAQIFRAYHAIRSGMTSPVTQEPTNATFGFVGMLLKLLRQYRPDYLIVTIDVSGDRETFRSEIYPQYKANRAPAPEDLHPQTERIVALLRAMGTPVLGIDRVEADDTIATLAERLSKERPDLLIRIVSKDKDLQQLLGEHVSLVDVHTDETCDVAALMADKGITPAQVIDMLALMGDTVDNVPGVPGVGPKTAGKLIAQYGSLDNLLHHTGELKGKLRENIEAHAGTLATSRRLVELRHDVPVEVDWESARVRTPAIAPLHAMFKQLGFNRHERDLLALAGVEAPPEAAPASEVKASPVKRRVQEEHHDGLFAAHAAADAPEAPPRIADTADYRCIRTREELGALVATLRDHVAAGGPVSVDTETDQLDPMRAKLCGVCLAWKTGSGVYVPVRSSTIGEHLDETTVLEALRPILEDPAVIKVGHNLKYDMLILRNAGVNLAGVGARGFDTIVASYLIDATRSSHKLDHLSMAFLGREMIPITELIGSGKSQRSMAELTAERVTRYAAEDADVALRLHEHFAPQLRAMGLAELFRTLEMPLVEVLAELEYNGVRVDPSELERQNRALDTRIGELYDAIMHAAGGPFNPDSPKQLADVLFHRLGCKVVKKLKSGPSTDSEVLDRIANEQDPPGSTVAQLIIDYRQLTKLRGTYLESLREAINPRTGRIHASFNQTVTVTGRLSSSDPNLQNIPIRTDIGRQIRKAFIAPSDHVLLGADYSQIELRLLAHLSQDPGLLEAFREDRDIHRMVAAQVFAVDEDAVTSEQRGVAKMVNFGIVYGITPFGLSRRLPSGTAGSDVKQAERIIADYKARYPKITAFLERCVETAKSRGYVETIAKRRRAIPHMTSRNPQMRGFAERTAINTVVQGSAADLIKMAMVALHRRIRDERRPMKMLLQIHDELVFEVPAAHVEAEAEIVRHEMQSAMTLSVPLRVDLSWGGSWFETK